MFALGIRYLNGWAMATHPSDRERAEWPPHPDRVFMALAAAYFETDGGPEERAALEWLEKQGDERREEPHMTASECFSRAVVTTFVPVNDDSSPWNESKKKPYQPMQDLGIGRNRQPRSFPVAIPDDPVVFLTWPGAKSIDHAAALESLCGKVTYIGHSASLAQMWVEPSPPASRWAPLNGVASEHRLRVPYEGRLAELDRCFNKGAADEFAAQRELQTAVGNRKTELKQMRKEKFRDEPPRALRPVARSWKGYASVAKPQPELDAAGSKFDSGLLILRRLEGPRLGLESTLQMTQTLRSTVMSRCPVQPPPSWISGHEPDGTPSQEPHLAFIPLSDVEHAHADGHLLGVAIAVPWRVSAEEQKCLNPVLFYTGDDERADAEHYAGTPRALDLTMGRAGVWRVELVDDDPRVGLQQEKWTGRTNGENCGSLLWATVTPIVFDRHPKESWSDADPPRARAEKQAAYWKDVESMIADATERIGLPRPAEVTASPDSVFRGAPSAGCMPRMLRKNDTQRRQTHAVIRFDQQVVGPVLLGAGRYRGYGLCRPLREGDKA